MTDWSVALFALRLRIVVAVAFELAAERESVAAVVAFSFAAFARALLLHRPLQSRRRRSSQSHPDRSRLQAPTLQPAVAADARPEAEAASEVGIAVAELEAAAEAAAVAADIEDEVEECRQAEAVGVATRRQVDSVCSLRQVAAVAVARRPVQVEHLLQGLPQVQEVSAARLRVQRLPFVPAVLVTELVQPAARPCPSLPRLVWP